MALKQNKENKDKMKYEAEKERHIKKDTILDINLHWHDMTKLQKYSEEVLQGMKSTQTGKALIFVQHILSLHCLLQDSAPQNLDITSKVNVMTKDDMVLLTERLLQTQTLFKASGTDVTVDIGYHYKKSS